MISCRALIVAFARSVRASRWSLLSAFPRALSIHFMSRRPFACKSAIAAFVASVCCAWYAA